nr:hypothetical protein Iba_scaffold31788CG0010 [Ipomoea batatas]
MMHSYGGVSVALLLEVIDLLFHRMTNIITSLPVHRWEEGLHDCIVRERGRGIKLHCRLISHTVPHRENQSNRWSRLSRSEVGRDGEDDERCSCWTSTTCMVVGSVILTHVKMGKKKAIK